MGSQLTFSIITPSFNQGKYIRQTIESVLKQKNAEIDYLVKDGGSQDDTVSILRSYGKQIRWVSKPDNGQVEALNFGVKQSSCDIIGYINSDDYYLPGALEKVRIYFENHPEAMWLTGDCKIIDSTNIQIQKTIQVYKRILRLFPYFPVLCVANGIAQPATFWRIQAAKTIGLFDASLHFAFDYDYWLRLMVRYPAHVLHDELAAFRIHALSKGGTQFIKQFEEELHVMDRYTSNRILRNLHKLHIRAIIGAYTLIK